MDLRLPYAETLARRADAISRACLHADGRDARAAFGALDTPIVLSSAFAFSSAEEAAGAFRGDNDAYIYGRWKNPTVEALESELAALEECASCCVTASGMAAVSGALLSLCESGSHVVAPRSMYAESARLLRERLPRLGITTTFVDAHEPGAYAAAITPATRVLYIETPSNPNLRVTDVIDVVALARARGLVTVADNTFATPFCQTPHALGVDLVVHSMTKALGGHGDVIGGAICGAKAAVDRARDLVVKGFGGVLAPLSAYLVSRGLRTFHLRQERACRTAAFLSSRLTAHPAVKRVHHPSLADHPGREVAARQMHAFGSLVSFELGASKDGTRDALACGRAVLEGVKLVTHAVSLGDTRSLLVHPASTTHSTMPAEARRAAGIDDGLLRMSVGLESAEDLALDLERALDAAYEHPPQG